MQPNVQSGFTLLETLVALVVLGMLISGLTQGLRIGVSAWQIQQKGLSARSDLHGTDTLLRTLVTGMDPGGVSGEPSIIVGTAHSLVFTSTLPQAADASATREADVKLLVDDDHRLQLLWITHVRNRIRPAPLPERATLMQEVDHLEIAYWKDARDGWLSKWTGPTLPRLIRIRIAFSDTGRRRVPDIVVSPMRARWRQ
jgi:general secretion pathway protein J